VLWSAQACAANLFPNPTFDDFDGDLPAGWTSEIWNQPMIKERIHRLSPGRDGTGSCLEIEETTPMTVMSLSTPAFAVSPDREYLFKGYYASTCRGVATDKRWKDAEGISLSGTWLDAETKSIDTFTIVLPDTQDRWMEFFQEVRSPEAAQELKLVLSRRWVGGRLRFDDFTLREGTLRDFKEEFSIPHVPDEDFFPIYGWLIPGLSVTQEPDAHIDSDHHHALYALANFNLGNKAVFGLKRWLDRFEPIDDAELAAVAEDETVWGFHWGDEPGEQVFPKIAEVHERFRRLVPTKPFWVNLLPTYGFESLEEYEHYIQAFIETVKPTMFTYDHYCMVGNDPQRHADSWYSPNREGTYFANLEIVRRQALAAGSEFGVIVSVGTFGPVRGASEAELRWQAFTTLAYGARSLGWFCYLTEVNSGHWTNWEDMVINRDGTRTRHYAMMKALNGEILNWGPTLLRLTSTGVYHTESLPDMTRPLTGSTLVESIRGGMGLVGEFRHQDGSSYVMIVNRDFIHPLPAQVKLRGSPKKLFEVSRQTGETEPATGYSSNTAELNVQLAAGDARLYCLEEEHPREPEDERMKARKQE
jgi:hypothetical protein